MQLSYTENNIYFLSMDSSVDGNMYLKLYKKTDNDNGELLIKFKVTEHCYKRGSKLYHELEDQINKNTLTDIYIEEKRKEIAGLMV